MRDREVDKLVAATSAPSWFWLLPASERRKAIGGLLEHRGKHYSVCAACMKLVRVDKPFLGAAHFH